MGAQNLPEALRLLEEYAMAGVTLGSDDAARLQATTRALSGKKAGLVGNEPDVALLASMATCMRHDFGLLSAHQQQSMLQDMRKLWNEVMGQGYYRPENLIPAAKYRLLDSGEVIEPGDEFINDNAVDWVRIPKGHLFAGMEFRLGAFKQVRRPLPTTTQG